MKKITLLLLLAIIPTVGFSQGPWEFNGDAQGWTSTASTSDVTTNSGSITLTTTGGANPKLVGPMPTGIDATTNSFVAITVKVSDGGPTYIRTAYPKVGVSGYIYKTAVITTGDSEFKTYYIDLTNSNWTGTVDEFNIFFKDNDGSNSGTDHISTDETIVVDKVEFLAVLPTTLKETFNFNVDNDTEGFSGTNGSVSGPISGVLTFTPSATSYAKLVQSAHHVNATINKQVHITLKNNSAANNQLRFVASDVATLTQEISVSDAVDKIYSFDLSADAGWTGDKTFTIGIGSTVDGKSIDNGSVEISSIIVDNILSSEKIDNTLFSFSPNPAKDVINISSVNKVNKVAVYDITGRLILVRSNLTSNNVNISELNNGIYLVKIKDVKNYISVKKLVVSK